MHAPRVSGVSGPGQDAGMTRNTTIEITGSYDLAAVATMSFGHRDESGFD
jgi:hypothetical protein